MSMLAEPRRKQKWSVDPRNSTWSKDDNKFGQKMLERMGWSKGKGLGRSEQGATEHIKVKVKNDSHGLGANASHEDNWIAHQDDFNELLAQLNSCHGQNNSNESPPEEPKGFSLEEKSKTATKRVHYMKFTKGKDLSSRSETDLNCIFGKRGSSSKEQDQESNSSDSQEEKEETTVIGPTELDTETITNTVTSALTMQEYFAQRMARLKKARGQAPSSDTCEKSESNPTHDGNNCSAELPKKKKKKKDKKAADEAEVFEMCEALVSEEHKEPEQSNPEKKKKKRKMHEKEGPLTLEEEIPPSKKKKKHKKDTEEINGHLLAEDDDVQSEVNKTEKPDEVESVFVEKKSRKDKKKKKKQCDILE